MLCIFAILIICKIELKSRKSIEREEGLGRSIKKKGIVSCGFSIKRIATILT
jgi:hypothetical protein